MTIVNGLIFGAGLGLVTACASGFADQYSLPLIIVGGLFMTVEISRIFMTKAQ